MSDRSGPLDPRLTIFGAHVRALRERTGLSMEDLAHAAGVSVRQLSRVEAGRASPSLLWLIDIAKALDVQVDALVTPFS